MEVLLGASLECVRALPEHAGCMSKTPSEDRVRTWRHDFSELFTAFPAVRGLLTEVVLEGGVAHVYQDCTPGPVVQVHVSEAVESHTPCTCFVTAAYDDQGTEIEWVVRRAQLLRRSCDELEEALGMLTRRDLEKGVAALLRTARTDEEGILEVAASEVRRLRAEVLVALRAALAGHLRSEVISAVAPMALDPLGLDGVLGEVVPGLRGAVESARRELVEAPGEALVVMRESSEEDFLEDASELLSAFWLTGGLERRGGRIAGVVPVAVAAALEVSQWGCDCAQLTVADPGQVEVAKALALDGTGAREAVALALAL
jgi:hypothetical protein